MQTFYIHPEDPQPRLIEQAANMLRADKLLIYPTDTSYAFACRLGAKDALEKLKQIRNLDDKHQFTLLCRDLSEIANYATVDNVQFKQLKAHTPAPITFILNATKDVPKKLAHIKKKTIGIRVPSNAIAQALLAAMDEPILTSSLILPNRDHILDDPFDIEELLGNQIDGLINAGIQTIKLTTIVDMTNSQPEVIRQGAADVSTLLL